VNTWKNSWNKTGEFDGSGKMRPTDREAGEHVRPQRRAARIASEYERRRTTQDYQRGGRSIAGVVMSDLDRHIEEGGDLQEIARLGKKGSLRGFASFHLRQLNYSIVEPGAVKAFHLHRRQDDIWFVTPESRLLVGLLDCRAASSTKGIHQRFTMGAGRSRLLYIPRGVAHGVSNPSNRPGAMFYLLNAEFSPSNPDEHRLPWDTLGPEFWTIKPG
jgi:dTDP-4-dehydrorhamnose 3,5-epimerase